jgi:dsDNA-specific endonuclease/ATPase MutS2
MEDILYQTLENDRSLFVIDLHKSENVTDALDQLEKELFSAFQNKVKYCRVVHGIGEGVLKKAVVENLKRNPLVYDFREGESGGDCIVEV